MKERKLLKTVFDRKRVLLVFAGNAAVMLLTALFLLPQAINNDDYIIHAVTAGAYGEASAVTVHTNYLLSLCLVLAQRALPAGNWFSVLEFAMIFAAFGLTGGMLAEKRPGWIGAVLAAAPALLLSPFFYGEIHNTKLAPLAALAGLLAFFYGVTEKRTFFALSGGALALAASCLRLNAFFVGAAFAAGAGMALLVSAGRKERFSGWWQKNRRLIFACLMLFAAVALFAAADAVIVASDPAAAEYRAYNRVRGAVSDFPLPDYAENFARYQAVGISENDFRLIEEWNFADREKFDTDTLIAVAAIRGESALSELPSAFFARLPELIRDPFFLMAVCFAAASFFISERRGRLLLLWAAFAWLACFLYMCWIARTTRWVTAGLNGCLFLSAAYAAGLRGSGAPGRACGLKKKTAVLLLAALLTFSGVFYGVRAIGGERGFNREAGRIYGALLERKENLYLFDHATQPAVEIHRISPLFSGLPFGIFQNSYALGGWDTASPAKESVLARYGAAGSPYRALLERTNVFLVDTRHFDEKLIYLRQNYAAEATMSLYDVVEGHYVFAFAEPVSGYAPDRSLAVAETALSADEILPDYYYLGVTVRGGAAKDAAAYLELQGKGGQTLCYRARLIPREDGFSAVCSVSAYDLPNPDDYKIRVVLQEGASLRATSAESLSLGG